MRRKWWMIPIGIVAITLFLFIGGNVVMYLWNWLLPGLFGWKLITFWQALALLVLCRILFGGIGGRHAHRGGWGRRRDWEKWKNMTPEERERMKQNWREHRGWCPPGRPESEPQA
ncbi:hypothetical protein Acid345_3449 [Candidatus Koribacter versatilis Ellin345]|uniref:Uncharacterized protein n=1 Tax=Koribacter versatilis (strain Ellin345) TaxID=204669 RepID=Q1IL00_KORVE|nr:hypothetical protein [Candidatus Koribacter versatilis]ABF42450.1 hypothetical protein Acid345_3449 [Candidatus Koribacter versatilis Ellin345]